MLASLVLSLLVFVSSAAAALYPTRPIASTVFSAGRMSTITWIDDGTAPSLSQIGPMRIDLYYGDDNYIGTLAQNVDPSKRSKSLWISPTLGPNGTDYYLRFVSDDPPSTVYSSRFTLAAMDDTLPYHRSSQSQTRSTTYPLLEDNATSSVTSSSSVPTSSNSSSASMSSTRLSTSTVSSSYVVPTSTSNPYKQQNKNSAGSSGPWKRNTVDMERLKFRLVFILWPLLIGVTMAL